MTSPDYIEYILPFDIMFKVDWYGWLEERKVSGLYNTNTSRVIFDFPEDFLAFKLAFGLW